jgi:hypothetical protein
MLRNHAFQVKLVNTKKNAENPTELTNEKTVDPTQIAEIATEYTIKTIGAIGAVFAANKVLSTICEIAVVAAKAKIK